MPKRSLALDFLVATYGPDKLADPTQAEPVVQRMIQLAPNEPTNYFQLAKIYEDSGEYQLAEETYLKGRDAKPNDPTVYLTVAGYYNRQGDFDKLIENLKKNIELEPQQSRGALPLATYHWDKASRDFRLSDAQKMAIIQDGLAAVDKALEIKPDYIEAMTYKGLLLRTQALVEKDPATQQRLIREGTALGDKANEMRKAKRRANTFSLSGDRPKPVKRAGCAPCAGRPVFSFTCTSSASDNFSLCPGSHA